MPLKNYSLLKGELLDYQEERDNDTPHFQVKVNADREDYRIAVNVLSAASPSELKYIVINDFSHAITEKLKDFEDGMHGINSEPNGVSLDYIRGNLFSIEDMKLIPHTMPGPDNDLNDMLKMYSDRAMRQDGAKIYAFGEKWPKSNQPDRYFGFVPQQGIHDIHMNQGNSGRWMDDNGIYQDGGLIFYFPQNDQWVGVFLAFQSQAIHTNDLNGNPIGVEEVVETEGSIKVIAALVNPAGHDRGKETVTLMNVSNEDVNLKNWKLQDHRKVSIELPSIILSAGDAYKYELTNGEIQLSNRGGQITLLDPQNMKVDGVSYSRMQVSRQGWSIVF